ncbi:MAG: hypothetical protein CVU89_14030 [Firmicutes bacterium HGW-Firmicutes-14]|nr:MAG: hypothetical protein CVU89_14030 [Firmicutes bacterium HGW-Firmicutes-14]
MINEGWGLPVAIYLFLGGLAAAAYYIGVTADIVSKGRFSNLARLGSYIVVVPIALGLLMLLLDLGKPLKFWHLMIQNGPLNDGLIFRPSSAMSLGVWLLNGFSLFCGLVYPLLWLAHDRKIPGIFGKDSFRQLIGIMGLPFAVMVAVYTGVLLSVTTQPIWADTPLLPVLFVISATSTGLAAISLALLFFRNDDAEAMLRLERGDRILIILELAVVAVLFIWLLFSPAAGGPVRDLLIGRYAVFFWIGFIIPGLLLPLYVQLYIKRNRGLVLKNLAITSSLLVLVGGFYLRYIMILAAG